MVTFLKTWPSGREKSQGTESKTHVSTYKSKSSKKHRKFHEEVAELCVVQSVLLCIISWPLFLEEEKSSKHFFCSSPKVKRTKKKYVLTMYFCSTKKLSK